MTSPVAETMDPQQTYEAWLEQLARWVQDGDLDAILQDLAEHVEDGFDIPTRLQALDAALAVVARKGPEPVIDALFARMLAICLGLHTRMESKLQQHLRRWDRTGGEDGTMQWVQTCLLPNLEKLQLHSCQIAKSFASLKRNLNLAQRNGDGDIEPRVGKPATEATHPAVQPVPELSVG